MTEENLDLMCNRCRLEMTQEEFQDSPKEEPLCRKCVARENRLCEFWAHMNDDEYWQYDKVPAWEFWANRIVLDAEDTSIFVHDINMLKEEKVPIEDYIKIIEVLRDAFLWAKYDDRAFELPR